MARKKRKKKSKGIFMRLVVVFCIAYVVHIIEKGMDICESQAISPTSIVTAAIAFFGVELCLCIVKRIWAKDDSTTQPTINQGENMKDKINNDFNLPLG